MKTRDQPSKKNKNTSQQDKSGRTCMILYVQPCRTRSLAHTLCPFSASLSTRVFWLGVNLTWLRSKGAGLYPLVCMKLMNDTQPVSLFSRKISQNHHKVYLVSAELTFWAVWSFSDSLPLFRRPFRHDNPKPAGS